MKYINGTKLHLNRLKILYSKEIIMAESYYQGSKDIFCTFLDGAVVFSNGINDLIIRDNPNTNYF